MAATKNVSSHSYTYLKISQLSPGMKGVNVIGVVSFFRPPAKSRGTDFSCTLGLVDDSDHSLKCMLFNGEPVKLPVFSNSGDILCVRQGNVSMFDGKLQLICNRVSCWLLFQDDNDSPYFFSSNCTMTDVETNRVHELRKWAATSHALQGSSLNSSPMASPAPSAQQMPAGIQPGYLPNPSPMSHSDLLCWNQQAPPPGVYKNTRLSLTTLCTLSAGRSGVAVCGIVQLFKSAIRSRGKDYYSTLWLLDHTSHNQAISCTLFSPIEQLLPKDIPIGSIALLKGLKTNTYQGRVQALGYESTLIAVFPQDAPPTNAGWYRPSPQEIKVVQELQLWTRQQGPLLLNTTLNQICVGQFFNTACQVAAVHSCPEDRLTVLEVFDATIPKLECAGRDTKSGEWTTTHDVQLCAYYGVYLSEVHLNDCDQQISPGNFILLCNVYAKPLSLSTEQDSCSVKLTILPKHMSGAVKVLDTQLSGDVAEFITNFPVPFGPFPVLMSPSTSPSDVNFEILNEESKRHASVEEVLKSPIGSVFVMEGEITCFAQGPVDNLSQLRCSVCRKRYITPQPDEPLLPDDLTCTFCRDSTGMGSPVYFTYMFTMTLRDTSGSIDICVTAREAEKFLEGIPPVNLHVDTDSRERLVRVLYMMTGGNDPFYPLSSGVEYERPKVKCCVITFLSVDGTTRFSLMDTIYKNVLI